MTTALLSVWGLWGGLATRCTGQDAPATDPTAAAVETPATAAPAALPTGLKPGTASLTDRGPTADDGSWFFLTADDLEAGEHHTRHAEIFGKYVTGYNRAVLAGVDRVQASAPDGGGYFIGIKAVPTESPIGYELKLFDKALLEPPRTTSYCSGASYSAFIEGLNQIYPKETESLAWRRFESLRMQELDGGRREDHVKFWGEWNADGFGTQFALVQYSGMGEEVLPQHARPGDFANISWKSGNGHSVVFLGWYEEPAAAGGAAAETPVAAGADAAVSPQDETPAEAATRPGRKMLYWASQKGTNGLGDQLVSLDRIKEVKMVRLTHPEQIFHFDPESPVNLKVPGDEIPAW